MGQRFSQFVIGLSFMATMTTFTGCGISAGPSLLSAKKISRPLASLSLPSIGFLKSGLTSTMTLAFANASSVNLTSADVTVTTTSGNAMCTVTVSAVSLTGATISLGNCTGDGTLTVHVNAGAASDASANPSAVSSESSVITIENTPPTLVSLTPATATLGLAPTALIATFSSAIAPLSAANFVVAGSCSLTKGSVSMSPDNKVATLPLTGPACSNTQTVTASLDPTAVTDLVGNAGTGVVISRTYTISFVNPVAALAAPSTLLLNSSGSATLALTYTGAASSTLTTAGVTITTVSGNPSCSVSVASVTSAGATVSLTNCSGNGTLSVHVNAGTAADGSGHLSTVSAESSTITVDNTAPTLVSLSPSTSSVSAAPTSIIATFSKAVTPLIASKFSIGGTCARTKGAVAMSAGNTVATLALSGAACANAQTVTASIDPTTVSDPAGNSGTGSVVTDTYTINLGAPTATLAAPTVTLFNAAATSHIALSYTNATATTLNSAGITVTVLSGNPSCTVGVTGLTAAGANITLSSCSGNGTLSIHVNAATATNGGTPSTASGESATLTVDNVPPMLSSLTPATGSSNPFPAAVVATFSEAISTLSSANFAITGSTCSMGPTVTSVAMTSGNTVATANLSGTCSVGNSFTVTVNPATTTDLAGNAGTGSATSETYTVSGGSPAVLAFDASYAISCANSGDHTFTVSNTGGASAVIGTLNASVLGFSAMTDAPVTYTGGTCSGATVPVSNSCTVMAHVDGSMGCGSVIGNPANVTLPYNDGTQNQTALTSITISNG